MIKEIQQALARCEYNEEFFSAIPQAPHYVNYHYVHSNTTERQLVGYDLAAPDLDLFGIKVYQSEEMGKRVPVRVHKEARRCVRSDWMTGTVPARGPNYHPRIQKKWNKRFGFKTTPHFALVGGGSMLVVSPAGMVEIQADAFYAGVLL